MSRTFDCNDPAQRDEGIAAAADAVRRGELVVLPTDTVYGIGADAFTPMAIEALLTAKGRGRDMPVPVLVGSWRTLEGLVENVPPMATQLTEAFWPGALTIVVRHTPTLAWDLGDARGTVAVRMPLHPVALDLLEQVGPMGVSSANRTGASPATTAAEAEDQLGEYVSVYLEAGPAAAAMPSTIVDLTGIHPRVLRLGAVPLDALRDVIPDLGLPA